MNLKINRDKDITKKFRVSEMLEIPGLYRSTDDCYENHIVLVIKPGSGFFIQDNCPTTDFDRNLWKDDVYVQFNGTLTIEN